jgi:hypothetical protein
MEDENSQNGQQPPVGTQTSQLNEIERTNYLLQSVIEIRLSAQVTQQQQTQLTQVVQGLTNQINDMVASQVQAAQLAQINQTTSAWSALKFHEPQIFKGKAADAEPFLNEIQDTILLSVTTVMTDVFQKKMGLTY